MAPGSPVCPVVPGHGPTRDDRGLDRSRFTTKTLKLSLCVNQSKTACDTRTYDDRPRQETPRKAHVVNHFGGRYLAQTDRQVSGDLPVKFRSDSGQAGHPIGPSVRPPRIDCGPPSGRPDPEIDRGPATPPESPWRPLERPETDGAPRSLEGEVGRSLRPGVAVPRGMLGAGAVIGPGCDLGRSPGRTSRRSTGPASGPLAGSWWPQGPGTTRPRQE
jgi:hypothetical protein